MNEEPVNATSARLVPRGFDPAGATAAIPDSERPVSKLCDLVLGEALLNRASQVRLAEADQGTVEFMIGGNWKLVMQIPLQAHRVLVGRLKQFAGLEALGQVRQSGEIHVLSDTQVRGYPLSIETLSPAGDLAIIRFDAAAT